MTEEQKKLRRKIEDFMRKYASPEQLEKIARILGIK